MVDGGSNTKMYRLLGSLQFHVIFLVLLTFATCGSDQNVKKFLSLTISSRKNQTGHAVTQLLMDKSLPQFPDKWDMKIKSTFSEGLGVETFHLDTVFAAGPQKPRDYEYFPGVGYYKFHTAAAKGFEEASSRCGKEGGHLAIVNSESEHQVLSTMFSRFPESTLKTAWAYVGFHDRLKEGEHVTIFGQPLNATGFTRWSSSNQPDNAGGRENCGSVHRNGGLNDISCEHNLPFFCESDLSWQ